MEKAGEVKRLSVIVPIYRGQKYIVNLIKMIEAGIEKLGTNMAVEMIISNDDPEDVIEGDFFSKRMQIAVLNTDVNKGIHGARIAGLLHCTGDFVLFLDQDDWISASYFVSQMKKLEDSRADAVVCRAKENGREIYNASYSFEKTIDYMNMVSVGNMIVSPGQVLIRRNAIPDLWQHNILKNNGVDDWFLWICMLEQGRHFVLNEEILFEHRIEGSNLSWNSEKMLASEKEMLEVIKATAFLDKTKIQKLENLIESEQKRYIDILEKYRKMFFVYDKWMCMECHKGAVAEYLYGQGVKKIAVYGMGYIGTQLVNKLQGTNVCVVGAIDRNAGFIEAAVPVVRLEEFDEDSDLIIVAVCGHTSEIVQDIKAGIDVPIITIEKLLKNWDEESALQYE